MALPNIRDFTTTQLAKMGIVVQPGHEYEIDDRDVRAYALKILATMAKLNRWDRRRVLIDAARINAIP